MRRRNVLFTMLALPAMALVAAQTGCVDDRIVYIENELFTPPPSGAASFLGYSKAEDKLTVCGNCHVGHQANWQATAHAGAFASLESSDHAQALCEGCHTVGQLGNTLASAGGWEATKDPRYKDVQCESCHGPGLGHATDPSKGTANLVMASMAVAPDGTTGCGECHQGSHHPFVEEWSGSAHGRGPNQAYAGSRAECVACHNGEDALLAWGVNSNYREKSQVVGNLSKNMPITCTVCHDPHANKEEGQLRFPIDVADEEDNLCMKCHHKRGVPDPTTFRGPHSPEGPVLLGYGGWWPPNLQSSGGKIAATHGSDRNPRLCAGCHVNKFSGTDATGKTFFATGHSFAAIPCMVGGKPAPEASCELQQRTFQTCAGAGCHGSEAVARSLMITAEMRLHLLVEELDRTLQKVHANWKTCRTNNSCGAGSPFNTADGKYTTAEGAAFNHDLGLVKSSAVHNPFLVEALLTASIRQVRTDYGITAPATVDLNNVLAQH